MIYRIYRPGETSKKRTSVKSRFNRGKQPILYFFRDNNGHEIDLLYSKGRRLFLIEIKAAMTWNSNFLKGIDHFQRTIPASTESGAVIYGGEMEPQLGNTTVINFKRTGELFQ